MSDERDPRPTGARGGRPRALAAGVLLLAVAGTLVLAVALGRGCTRGPEAPGPGRATADGGEAPGFAPPAAPADGARSAGAEALAAPPAAEAGRGGSAGARRPAGGAPSRTLRVGLASELVPFESLLVRLERRTEPPWSEERWIRDRTAWQDLVPALHELSVSGAGWRDERRSVDLAAADAPTEVVVRLRPLASLAGVVVDATTGAALPRFRLRREVLVEHPDQPPVVFANKSLDVSDPEGRFAVGGLPLDAARLRLAVEAEGYDPGSTEWFPPGTEAAGLVVELWPSGRGAYAVEGRVVDAASGRGLAGTHVRLVPPGFDPEGLPPSALATTAAVQAAPAGTPRPDAAPTAAGDRTARTAADGSFRIEARAPGTVAVLAIHDERLPAVGPALVLRRGETVAAGELRLARGARLLGRVVVDSGLEPPPRLGNVVLLGEYATVATETDDAGLFRFEGLAAGRWRVLAKATVVADGREREVQIGETVELEAGGMAEIELHVGPRPGGLLVAGHVLTPSAELERWGVALVDLDSGESRAAAVDPDGAFELEGIPPARYLLAAQAVSADGSRVALAWRELVVRSSGDVPFLVVECAPRAAVLVRGTCEATSLDLETELDDPLLAGLGPSLGTFAFDAEGRFVAHGLPAGSYVASCGGRETPFRVFGSSTGTDEIALGD